MTFLSNDPLIQLAFSIYESKGVYAVLLGSGLSRAAEIPTGWEITLDLIRRVALAQGYDDQPEWAAWYRQKTGKEPDYSTLLEELAVSPDERRAILHSYIEPTEEDREEGRKVPTAAHRAIAVLVQGGYIRVIATTYFDRLMENALRERGIEPTIVTSDDALAGAEPITHSACYILKLHGDYKDARILNTDAELSSYPAKYNRLLDRILDEYGLIICGWSGEWDHALRAAFLRTPNRRYPVFWAARGKLGDSAEELVKHRRARVIPIADANGFFSTLQQRIETLEHSQRQNPLSIELLVKSAKRFLAKPEHRIQLDDLITQETQRALTQLDAPELAPQGSFDPPAIRARVQRYEAITEALASMAGVLGRWGDGNELPLVLDMIRSLCAQAEKIGAGVVVHLNIRSYPAVLVFTAYGLGATRAGRWNALHQLFAAVIDRERSPVRAVEALFLQAWKGETAWRQMEEREKQHTPLSNHLFGLFDEWGKRFIGLAPNFELMFERFEMLGSLAHLERHSKASIRQELAQKPPYNRVMMPIGRAGWQERNSDKIISELQAEAMKAALIKTGFAKGDSEFIELFIMNFKSIAGHMRW